MELERLIERLDSASGARGNHAGLETHYRLMDIESELIALQSGFIELREDALFTPFYIDSSAYELYWCEMKVTLVSDDVLNKKDRINRRALSWMDELREALTWVSIPTKDPLLPVQDVLRYIAFLKTSYVIKSEIVSAFSKEPVLENYYLSIY